MEYAGVAQTGRASAFQAEGRGFESRRPLAVARVAQSVERVLGKDEVTGSIPVASSWGVGMRMHVGLAKERL